MASRSAMAVLAGASVLAPVTVNAGTEAAATPAPVPVQSGNTVSITVGPQENLSLRSDVVDDGVEYQFMLTVNVTPGRAAYGFQTTMATADNEGVVDAFVHAMTSGSPGGEWYVGSGMGCFGQQGMTNINWTAPSSGVVTLSLHVDKAKFDAHRARLNKPITISAYMVTYDSCDNTQYYGSGDDEDYKK